MTALNPKNGQGDGAGFNRLRAAQKQREQFARLLKGTHPSCTIYIDQVREYAGVQIAFYRSAFNPQPGSGVAFEHARVAVFVARDGGRWAIQNDIIAAQA